MAKIQFFLGADADLNAQYARDSLNLALNMDRAFPESLVDQMAILTSVSDQAAEAVAESGERIYTLECEIASGVDPEALEEELSVLLFEGGMSERRWGDQIRVTSIL